MQSSTDENQLKVSEQDHLSGRVSEGEEAMNRLLKAIEEEGEVKGQGQGI